MPQVLGVQSVVEVETSYAGNQVIGAEVTYLSGWVKTRHFESIGQVWDEFPIVDDFMLIPGVDASIATCDVDAKTIWDATMSSSSLSLEFDVTFKPNQAQSRVLRMHGIELGSLISECVRHDLSPKKLIEWISKNSLRTLKDAVSYFS